MKLAKLHIQRGDRIMKCLKIDNGKGYFLWNDNEFKEIDSIGKDDILRLLDIATDETQVFEMDVMDDSLLMNEAHRIIYRSLSQKYTEVMENKKRFSDESRNMFKEALDKYTNE